MTNNATFERILNPPKDKRGRPRGAYICPPARPKKEKKNA